MARSLDPLIAKLERLGPLSAAERAALEALPSRLREFRRHEAVAAAGDSPPESAILLTGMAFRVKLMPEGTRQIVALHVPGDFMDLHSFVLHPLDHSVVAASPALVGLVPHPKVALILEHHPRLTKRLMWDMAIDAAITREWMAVMGRGSALRQMAHLFCEIHLRMQQAGLAKNDGFDFPLSQIDLADICGLSAVHVNRTLQALRAQELIVLTHGRLAIPDLPRLVEAAGFDPAYLHLLTGR
jgi:CRP-like cAMP-binding protein